MRRELYALQRRLGMTFVFVTHDQTEALAVSDRIIVLSHGRIEQQGTPAEIYDCPRTRFVADFIGGSNLLEVSSIDGPGRSGEVVAKLKIGATLAVLLPSGLDPHKPLWVSVRPEKLRLVDAGEAGSRALLLGRPTAVTFSGDRLEVMIELERVTHDLTPITVTAYAEPGIQLQQKVGI